MKKLVSFLIVIVMIMTVIPVAYADAYHDGYIYENTFKYVAFNSKRPCSYYTFVANEEGYYKVISFGNEDTYAYCLDEEGNEVAFDDDGGYYKNFNCVFYAQPDEKYTIIVAAYNDDYTDTTIMLERLDKNQPSRLNLDEEQSVEIDTVDRSRYFEFEATKSDYYAFYTKGEYDTQAYMYDDKWTLIEEDANSGEGANCYLSYYLEEGKKYIFEVTNPWHPENSGNMSFDVGIKKTAVVEKINIIKYPEKMSYYKEFVDDVEQYVKFRGLECELVFSDGRKEIYKYAQQNEILGVTVETGFYHKDDGTYCGYVMASYGYAEFFPKIKDATIQSLTLNTTPQREYVFSNSAFGFVETDRYGNMTYNFHPTDISDISFDVNFSDGTSVTYTYDDVEKGFDRIDGYRYKIDYIPVSNHEIKNGKTFEATFNFLGKTLTYDVYMHNCIEPRGDVDMDGYVTVMDATKIRMYLAGTEEFNQAQLYCANVYYDGPQVDIIDATRIQQHVAGLWTIR